jgi:hypothetical protein
VEIINMLEYRAGAFPAKFSWQGREYEIEAVNECKTVTAAPETMHHFWVRSRGERLHLTHMLTSNQWALHRE